MNAQQILDAIREFNTDKQAMLDALCDGAALEAIGVTDDDQEAVEEAYQIVKKQA